MLHIGIPLLFCPVAVLHFWLNGTLAQVEGFHLSTFRSSRFLATFLCCSSSLSCWIFGGLPVRFPSRFDGVFGTLVLRVRVDSRFRSCLVFVYSNCSAVLVSHVCVVFRVLVCVRPVSVWCLHLFDSRAVASCHMFVYVLTLTLTLRRCSGLLLPSSTGVRPHASSTHVVHSVGGGNGLRIATRRSAELSFFWLRNFTLCHFGSSFCKISSLQVVVPSAIELLFFLLPHICLALAYPCSHRLVI